MADRHAYLDISDGQRLEIGAGDRPSYGFIHHDARDLEDIEIVCDALEIRSVTDAKFSEIRANHILEHFSWLDTVDVLSNWCELLQPNGMIHIEVPNLAWQTKAHAAGEIDDRTVVNYMYGDQDYEGNYHKAAFTENLLKDCLEKAGFSKVVTQDIGQVVIAVAMKV